MHSLWLLQSLLLISLPSQCANSDCTDLDSCRGPATIPEHSLLQRSVGRHAISSVIVPGLSTAKDALPPKLLELGKTLFGSELALDGIVANSTCGLMSYANVTMEMCIADGDDALHRLPGEGGIGYGLDTLSVLRDNSTGMINVADVGGSYGVVTIATFKIYNGKVRSVVAEPVPATYFYMVWNMHLNGIPMVDEADFHHKPYLPGVIALHKGVSGAGDSLLRICSPPWSTMNSYMSLDTTTCKCTDDLTPCHEVESIPANDVLNMLGSGDISLLKLDCEGCEHTSLPAIANGAAAGRVKRLVGELHVPEPSLVQLACKWDNAAYLTAFCGGGVGRVDGPGMCEQCNGQLSLADRSPTSPLA